MSQPPYYKKEIYTESALLDEPFRLCSKKLLLTYHGFSDTLEDLREFLHILFVKQRVLEYAISFHANTNNSQQHAHAYIDLEKKLDTKNQYYFDYYNYSTKSHFKASVTRIKDRYQRNSLQKIHIDIGLASNPIEYVLKEVTVNSVFGVDYLASKNIYRRLGLNGNLLSASAAAVRSATNQNVSEALDILGKEDAEYLSMNYSSIKQNFKDIAQDSLPETYDSQQLILHEYLYTKIEKIISSIRMKKSASLVFVGKSMACKAGVLLHYLNAMHPDLNVMRITSFKHYPPMPVGCKVIILDNVSLKIPENLEQVKSLILVVSKVALPSNQGSNLLQPPVATILISPNKTALRPLQSTLRALNIEPVLVSNTDFLPSIEAYDAASVQI